MDNSLFERHSKMNAAEHEDEHECKSSDDLQKIVCDVFCLSVDGSKVRVAFDPFF